MLGWKVCYSVVKCFPLYRNINSLIATSGLLNIETSFALTYLPVPGYHSALSMHNYFKRSEDTDKLYCHTEVEHSTLRNLLSMKHIYTNICVHAAERYRS